LADLLVDLFFEDFLAPPFFLPPLFLVDLDFLAAVALDGEAPPAGAAAAAAGAAFLMDLDLPALLGADFLDPDLLATFPLAKASLRSEESNRFRAGIPLPLSRSYFSLFIMQHSD
jgi:hypothetical protein